MKIKHSQIDLEDVPLTGIPTAPTAIAGTNTTQLATTAFVKALGDLKQNIAPTVQTVTSAATVTPVSTNDMVIITAQAVNLTIANPTGTFVEGQSLIIRIKDDGTARTITYGVNYRVIHEALPTETVIGKVIYLGILYNAVATKWDVVGISLQI